MSLRTTLEAYMVASWAVHGVAGRTGAEHMDVGRTVIGRMGNARRVQENTVVDTMAETPKTMEVLGAWLVVSRTESLDASMVQYTQRMAGSEGVEVLGSSAAPEC